MDAKNWKDLSPNCHTLNNAAKRELTNTQERLVLVMNYYIQKLQFI